MIKLTNARADFSRLRDQVFTYHSYPSFGLLQAEMAARHGDDQDTTLRLNSDTTPSKTIWDNFEANNLIFRQRHVVPNRHDRRRNSGHTHTSPSAL